MSGNLQNVRKPPVNRTLGIEIECLIEDFQGKYNHHGFFYADDDESISRLGVLFTYTSVEWVSQPLTLPWMHRELSRLNKKFNWVTNDSCGIHVHVSRKWLSEKKAKTIYKWLQEQDYDDIKELFGRSPNEYCRLSDAFDTSRYLALNNENKATIEFRGFSSGAGAWPHWCVDFVTYLINHANHLNLDAVGAFQEWWFAKEAIKYCNATQQATPVVETSPAVLRARRVHY